MSNIKVIEKVGEKLGKTVVILAGIHGNEVCGVKAFDKLISILKIENGKVIFIYCNLEAIKQNKRFIEYNINRLFLKKQPLEFANTLEGKTARDIMKYFDEADMLLDIHASNSPDSVPFSICDEKNIRLAESMPPEIITYNWDRFEPGSTDYYMNLLGKPSLAVECGFLGDEKSQKHAEEAIINFLMLSGTIKGQIKEKNKKTYYKINGLYKNKNAPFKREREFADFEELKEKTLIGKEGNKQVFLEKGSILLFVRNRDNLSEECFLTAEKVTHV